MRYKIYSNGELVNTIIAEEDVVNAMCQASGMTYESDDITLTAEEQREIAYNTLLAIPWENERITVTHAALLWQYYAAEGSERAAQLTALIAAAKAEIRERIHD